jgi:hypothetical protein
VPGRGVGQLGVAIAAERVEGCFRGPDQVGARPAMAVQATANARFIDEVVMAGDAVDRGVFLVGEVDRQEGRRRCRLEKVRAGG